MPVDAVVADANVLLSAIVGKAALRVFTEHAVTVHATEFNASEVEEYLPRLASKYGLPEDLVHLVPSSTAGRLAASVPGPLTVLCAKPCSASAFSGRRDPVRRC